MKESKKMKNVIMVLIVLLTVGNTFASGTFDVKRKAIETIAYVGESNYVSLGAFAHSRNLLWGGGISYSAQKEKVSGYIKLGEPHMMGIQDLAAFWFVSFSGDGISPGLGISKTIETPWGFSIIPGIVSTQDITLWKGLLGISLGISF